ncbi:MAG: radical SAM protein [Candidatus Geothermarchaeales archaeon]
MKLFDPVRLAEETERLVVRGELKKYYRTSRPGRWYRGIATADCCGCCLRCVFCWSGVPRDQPEKVGKFYTPRHIFKKLDACARKFGYKRVRVSGNEPTIGKRHLLELLELVDQTGLRFILESNGILIGHDKDYAKQLGRFRSVYVRISIKGTNSEEFARLTGAVPGSFSLQLEALRNLLDAGVPCWPAVMLSFSPEENFRGLLVKLGEIDHSLVENVEEEYCFMYPHVAERLENARIQPRIAYSPDNIPQKLI